MTLKPSEVLSKADEPETYRDFRIYYEPPPIPVRDCDWHWVHEDYDGAEDANDNRYGHASSLEAAKSAIDEWHFDRCKCSSSDPLDCMAWECPNRDAARAALRDASTLAEGEGC